MTPIVPLLTLLLALAISPAAARLAPGPPPTLQPDDTTESFITRWNDWANETDPDRSVINAVSEETDAINASL